MDHLNKVVHPRTKLRPLTPSKIAFWIRVKLISQSILRRIRWFLSQVSTTKQQSKRVTNKSRSITLRISHSRRPSCVGIDYLMHYRKVIIYSLKKKVSLTLTLKVQCKSCTKHQRSCHKLRRTPSRIKMMRTRWTVQKLYLKVHFKRRMKHPRCFQKLEAIQFLRH